MPGNIAAQHTANSVIASAERLIDVRHFWRSRNKIAEINVPAWPMPIQNTKLVMSHAQKTGLLLPHTPTPVVIWYVNMPTSISAMALVTLIAAHQRHGV